MEGQAITPPRDVHTWPAGICGRLPAAISQNVVVRTLKKKQNNGTAVVVRHTSGEESLLRQVLLMALWGIVGMIVPRATVYGGFAPFGVGVAAAVSGPGSVVAYLATGMGYLLPEGAAFPLRYLAAVAAVAGIRWSLNGLKRVTGAVLFAPVTAFLASGCTGMAMTFMGKPDFLSLLTVVAESLLAGGFAYFVQVTFRITHQSPEKPLTAQEQASVVAVAAVVLMALSTVQFSGISPGRIFSILLILVLARCGREQGGSIAGIVLGAAMALAAPDQMYLAPAYALGGLLAGLFSRFGKLAAAASFVAVNMVVTLGANPDLDVVVGFYEAAAASVRCWIKSSGFWSTMSRMWPRPRDCGIRSSCGWNSRPRLCRRWPERWTACPRNSPVCRRPIWEASTARFPTKPAGSAECGCSAGSSITPIP